MILFLLKCHSGKQQVRNGCSRLFSTLFVKKASNNNWNLKKIGRRRDHVPKENIWKDDISRPISSQMVIKPVNIAFPTENRDTFMKMRPNIIKDLTEDKRYSDIPEAIERFSDCLHYNLGKGSYVVGLSVLTCYKMLEKPENLTDENIRLATILAWCAELVLTSYLLLDDILDKSETRQKAPCWFKIEGIGLTAVNDILFLENSAHFLLKKYFSSHPLYVPIVEHFRDACFQSVCGQCVDIIKPKIEEITLDLFTRSAMYKTSGFYLAPTILGMYLSNTYSAKLHRNIEPILRGMGIYLQIENDMLDCFGDQKLTGKTATDIREGRCTWPASIALQKANPVQRELMKDHYGKPGKESIEVISNLYVELGIPAEFAAYKEKAFKIICSQIENFAGNDTLRRLLFTQAVTLFNRK